MSPKKTAPIAKRPSSPFTVAVTPPPGAPAGLKYSDVRDGLLAVNGVTAVHNLHIWALTMNQAVLTAHVAIGERSDLHLAVRAELRRRGYDCGATMAGLR